MRPLSLRVPTILGTPVSSGDAVNFVRSSDGKTKLEEPVIFSEWLQQQLNSLRLRGAATLL